MVSKIETPSGNMILDSLAPACRVFLEERMLTKAIGAGEVLYEPDAPLHNLIFPLNGLVSLQHMLKEGRVVERMSIGMDGVIGAEYLIGDMRSPCQAVTVISGRASWLPVKDFATAMEKFPCVQPALLAYVVRTLRRLMQAVACASVHSATQRIASWLLHADDRILGSKFDITQRTLADIFGLRLATVSDGCNRLFRADAIHYSRGTLNIVSRAALESQACECYEATRLRSPLDGCRDPASGNVPHLST